MRIPIASLFSSAGLVFAHGESGNASLAAWWQGKQSTGDWFGARTLLAENGLRVDGRWRGIYFGVLESESGSGNAFSQELVFTGQLDLSKALRWENIEGLALFSEVR